LAAKPARPTSRARPWRQRLRLEALEDRVTPTLTPQMVLDINPGPASSYLSQMVVIGSTTYFTADDGVHGFELWKSDGTTAGTTLVKDIHPGTYIGYYGGYYFNSYSPSNLTNVNGTLFFGANDGTNRWKLWKSDGTEAGTLPVSSVGLYPSNLTDVNGTLFFTADDPASGTELWKSDGTAAGTVLVKDISPGGDNSFPRNLTNVNGTLFFTADDGTHGAELWKSDGTAAGTTMVKDIYPGSSWVYHPDYLFGGQWNYEPNSSIPGDLTNVNGTLFFAAQDGTHGFELWKSDGTTAGTTFVKDIFPGSIGSYPRYLTNVNGTLCLATWDSTYRFKLWKSDGTATGTTLVKDISPSNLTNMNGTLFLAADDGTHGAELWRSDGTAAGTVLVKDFNPGGWGAQPGGLTNVNGTLFLTADDGTGRSKLWRSDGTAAGTVPVVNLPSAKLTNINGMLFFAADDGLHGWELWKLVDIGSLAVSGPPGTITAGAVGSFTVTAKNADGTTNTGYLGTVHFTSSDPQADLPADYTFGLVDGGTHSFSVRLKTAGAWTVTAAHFVSPSIFVGPSIAGIAAVRVAPAAPSTITATAGATQQARPGTAFATPLSVGVRDAFGNPVPGVLVTFTAPATGPTGTFLSAIPNVAFALTGDNGVAQAPAIIAGAIGSFFVTASAPGVTTPATFAMTNLPPFATVQSAVLNDGAAQRSMVTSIAVTFNQVVTVAGAFFLTPDAGGPAIPLNQSVNFVSGRTVVTLTFAGAEIVGGSLPDGRYTLTVLCANVHDSFGDVLDGDGDGRPGGDNVSHLFRLFGDVNGDAVVNGLDLTALRSAFGAVSTDSTYASFLDFNGDGAVNGTDLAQFRNRFGVILP
jgi:ELWxxDGT repeat protein